MTHHLHQLIDFDWAPEGTAIMREDGRVAQKLKDTWYEVGCADPFDRGAYDDWAGSAVITTPEAANQQRQTADSHWDRILRIAVQVAWIDRGGNTNQALDTMREIIAEPLPGQSPTPGWDNVRCPECGGSGWINGATDTRTCWMCREAGYVTPAQTSLGSAA